MKATATRTSTSNPRTGDVRNAAPKLLTTERLVAEYWVERARPVDLGVDNDECVAKLIRLYQWVGDDLLDVEAKLEVALAETINELSCGTAVDVGIALLMASALLDIRRIRCAEQLAGEAADA